MAASPEALFISAVLQTKDRKAFTAQAVNEEMFAGYADEFAWIARHVDKYDRIPSKTSFGQRFPEFVIYEVDDIDHYGEEVRQAYAQAAMTDLMDDAVEHLIDGDVEKAMERIGTDLLRIQAVVQDQADDYDLASDYESTYKALKERVNRVQQIGSAGVPTGFGSLDANTGGLQPGWLCIVGGRLGTGKTWCMVRMAVEAVMSGYTALYYSLEQPRDQIAMRTHSMMSSMWWEEPFRGLDLVRGRGFDLQSYRAFLEAMEEEVPGRMVINDARRGRVGPMTVAAGIEREEPDIVFVDYLTLMAMKGDGGWLSVGDLSSSMQQLAQRYGVPIVIGSQLNRSAMGEESPDAGMIGRSDSVGQDADVVVMVARKSDSVRKMTLSKFRHGPDGINWFVRWKPNVGDITEVNGDEAATLIEQDQEVD